MAKHLVWAAVAFGLVLLFGLYVDHVAHSELTQSIRFIIQAVSLTAAAGLVVSIAGWTVILFFRAHEARAKAHQARYEALRSAALVTVADPGQQVYLTELGKVHTVTKPLHLSPATHLNGPGHLPTVEETQRWAIHQQLHAHRATLTRGNDAPLLEAHAGPVDLLAELDNVQRCLIVGPSNTGKTTLLKHVMARRLGDSRVVAVDPHSYAGKWPAHKVFGVGRDYGNVEWGLLELLRLMERRYDDIGRGVVPEMGHSKITLLVDEWRAIVQNVDGAGRVIGTLLTESRKAAFSVFVASHSERVKALGIEGEGDLKDGFCIVRLAIVNGERAATIDKGAGEQPVRLPGPFVAWQPPRQVEGQAVTAPAPTPNEQERQVIDLAESGASRSAIARDVFGSDGGNQLRKVADILAKWQP